VEFNADGSLSSVWDKEVGREMLAGAGNGPSVYYDDGDAWDFAQDYAARKPTP